MSTDEMRPLGWYPDEQGGTRLWDGNRWTGDVRPPRNSFSAASANRGWGIGLLILGVLFILTSPAQFGQEDPSKSPAAAFAFALVLGAGCAAWGVYLLRGRGPSTKDVLARLRSEQAVAAARHQPPPPSSQSSSPTIQININSSNPVDSVGAAQVKAIANPETAQSIQNLQKLLYSRAITDAEFQAAKNKLLGDL